MSQNSEQKKPNAYDRLSPEAQQIIDKSVDDIIDIAARMMAERDLKRAQTLRNTVIKKEKSSLS